MSTETLAVALLWFVLLYIELACNDLLFSALGLLFSALGLLFSALGLLLSAPIHYDPSNSLVRSALSSTLFYIAFPSHLKP